jgi:hypothetical protein
MHLRRALLLFALVLGMTAVAASVAPAPRSPDDSSSPASTAPTRPGPPEAALALSFRVPPKGRTAPSRRVAPGAHVVIAVTASRPGQVQIPALGRTETVTPATPARFDLIAPPPGRYDIGFKPSLGELERVGTLVTAR